MDHLFRECPASVSVQRELACQTFLLEPHLEFLQWLTWVFEQSASFQCRIFCCVLWAIWGDRNARVHRKINFDAAYNWRSCHSALGIVVRNSEGKDLLACSEIHQQVASAFVAEALACRRATQIGIDMQWKNIIIEEKSLVNSIAAETLKSKKEIFLIGRVPEYVEKQKERDSVREPD
ncbi:hypothetical protein GOBAR_AA23396 [Gossypium barbadense]|uniref:RNase H type-1 domain-containing protein n=1 Tax=Gossypium barbadense TaxID=3634 RepID=A0A2P5X1S2_GOSBA|nr:hypothetical protein GOBAR_AA23396 [Gossypium barbadense]